MPLWTESQILTRAAPTLRSEGIDLSQIKFLGGVRVFIRADGGNCTNITMQGWFWDDEVNGGSWARAPGLDFTATAVGQPVCAFERQPLNNRGRVLWASAGSTVSAGTTLTITAQGV
jgi:hypothetical protein